MSEPTKEQDAAVTELALAAVEHYELAEAAMKAHQASEKGVRRLRAAVLTFQALYARQDAAAHSDHEDGA